MHLTRRSERRICAQPLLNVCFLQPAARKPQGGIHSITELAVIPAYRQLSRNYPADQNDRNEGALLTGSFGAVTGQAGFRMPRWQYGVILGSWLRFISVSAGDGFLPKVPIAASSRPWRVFSSVLALHLQVRPNFEIDSSWRCIIAPTTCIVAADP